MRLMCGNPLANSLSALSDLLFVMSTIAEVYGRAKQLALLYTLIRCAVSVTGEPSLLSKVAITLDVDMEPIVE